MRLYSFGVNATDPVRIAVDSVNVIFDMPEKNSDPVHIDHGIGDEISSPSTIWCGAVRNVPHGDCHKVLGAWAAPSSSEVTVVNSIDSLVVVPFYIRIENLS
jgi:hypothetical protein